MREPIGVREQNEPHLVCPQAELVAAHHDARATHGTAAVTETELGRQDEDVVPLLGGGERAHRAGLLPRLTEPVGAELSLAAVVVVELAATRLVELAEDDLDRLVVVGRGDLLPRQDEEVTLRPRQRVLAREGRVVRLGPREVPPDLRELVGGRARPLVPGQVAVPGLPLIVHELVGQGEP